jgi:hypothetical protein
MGFLPTHCSNTLSSHPGEKWTIQIQSQFYGDCRKCVILQCQTGNDKAGIPAFQRAIFKVGAHVQERRELKERPLRVGIIGYPNVGKVILMGWCIVWWIHSLYSHTHYIYIYIYCFYMHYSRHWRIASWVVVVVSRLPIHPASQKVCNGWS